MTRVSATYEIESPVGIAHAAEVLAGEQSTGTFVKLAEETNELLERSAARIENVVISEQPRKPALPCKTIGGKLERGTVTISWPVENFGVSLPNVLTTVAGNLFELSDLSAIRLLDLEFPDEFIAACPGPRLGITGTRRLAGLESGPLIGTIIKPSIGMDAGATAGLVKKLAAAGINFIKDDELQANGAHCPFIDRVRAVMPVLKNHEEKTGNRVMYAFNITDDVEKMRRNLDFLSAQGATCAMVSLFPIGLAGLLDVRAHCSLAVHGHRAGWGLFSRSPHIGIDYAVWQKLWRLAGADHLHVNGLANKFTEPDKVIAQAARAVQKPLAERAGCEYKAMPVYSSAQTVWQMAPATKILGNDDFIFCAGGGIMSHPGGPGAGVTALRQAATAAQADISLYDFAAQHAELRQAMTTFKCPQIELN